MTFLIYVVGYVLVIAGVAWGLSKAGMNSTWILISCMILLGIGIATGATRTRSKDLPK